MADTIVALATPTGRSGIGVVRLSGPAAFAIADRMSGGKTAPPRKAMLRELRDPAGGEPIDEAILTYFKGPHSFTGEDIVEISCHGSPVLLRQVIDICLALDARMAEAGEFTLRALANGRLDLAEAEAIRDLIDSQTTAAARQAVRQLRGEFSSELQPIKDRLLDVIVVLESSLEFVEDDLPTSAQDRITDDLAGIADRIEEMAGTFRAGRLIREGLKVTLVGRPNVGKSSLFNALLGSDRAIVTEIAGTTRDQLHERFTVDNIPIALIDTAGLRQTSDTVESIGVERSRRAMADADLVAIVLDASAEMTDEDQEILADASELRRLIVLNKVDKLSPGDEPGGHLRAAMGNGGLPPMVEVSALTGEGLDELRRAIIEPFAIDDAAAAGFLVSDARHHDLLLRAASEVRRSIELIAANTSEEISLIGLHNALRYLGQITGETTTEDMLTRIFSTFCIGK